MRTRLLIVAACAVVICNVAAAQNDDIDTTRWSPAISMQYRAVGGVAMAPDAGLLAYTVRTPMMEGEQSEYVTHIWVVATDGSFDIQYTHGEHSASSPRFSPDGEFLAFTSSRSGKSPPSKEESGPAT